MPLVHFIRHAQSTANAGGKTVHPGSSGLSELGVRQAELTAGRFTEPPELIVHSPYRRTLDTARPLMDRFPHVAVEEWPVQEFTYIRAQGYADTTIQDRRPAVRRYWERADPEYLDGAGAETFIAFLKRVRLALARLEGLGGEVAFFSHGQFLRAALWLMLTGPKKDDVEDMVRFTHWRKSFVMPNCTVIRARLEPGEPPLVTGFLTDHLEEGVTL